MRVRRIAVLMLAMPARVTDKKSKESAQESGKESADQQPTQQ